MRVFIILLIPLLLVFKSCETSNKLTSQKKDESNLLALFTEIEELALSVSCLDANNWNFTTYGVKACGGPQGYIAYSSEINTSIFLQKIDEYTLAEKKYNIKWGIISTCDIQNPPISIECNNNLPVLRY